MEPADLHRRTVDTWTARVEAVPAAGWDAATPCTDWTVRELVNHVAGEDAWTVPLVRGASLAEVGGSLDGDLLGDDPVGSARRLGVEACDVVAEGLRAGGGKVHLSYGDEDLTEYVLQLSADHLLHAWDLAAATGGDTALDPALVQEVAAWFAEREEMYRSAGVVGDRVEVAGGAQEALLGAAGRQPTWTPPQR
jgi:uncharacterized protein (TIGR03086 family)